MLNGIAGESFSEDATVNVAPRIERSIPCRIRVSGYVLADEEDGLQIRVRIIFRLWTPI